jgi:nitrogen fixation protein NifB
VLDYTSAVTIMRQHPCFDERAHQRVGRVHLPVAPRCNIRCRYCERRICANLTAQHPGWAQRLLSSGEAVELVRRLVDSQLGTSLDGGTGSFVVGVAGPGEPLANDETLETLHRVHHEFPELIKCVSTNGLLLEQHLPDLIEVGVTALTVTINALDCKVGERIYAWVRERDTLYREREAAEILIARQMRGVRAALDAGLAVKVNTVLIPDVNGRHLGQLARHLAGLGVPLMNIMPLIPGGQMRDHRAPTCEELRQARADCEQALPQFRLCEQCRADVIRFPHRRNTDESDRPRRVRLTGCPGTSGHRQDGDQ